MYEQCCLQAGTGPAGLKNGASRRPRGHAAPHSWAGVLRGSPHHRRARIRHGPLHPELLVGRSVWSARLLSSVPTSSRQAVGFEATEPNTPAWSRSTARSAMVVLPGRADRAGRTRYPGAISTGYCRERSRQSRGRIAPLLPYSGVYRLAERLTAAPNRQPTCFHQSGETLKRQTSPLRDVSEAPASATTKILAPDCATRYR